jgi:CO/xanthine dehydrogenase Mo-binding subunit
LGIRCRRATPNVNKAANRRLRCEVVHTRRKIASERPSRLSPLPQPAPGASDEIAAKGTRIAAEALEAAEADIRFADGRFVVAGTDRSVALPDVAALARDKGTPLDTYHAWTREWMTFPNGAHVAEVEIDRDAGEVTLARYTAVDDYGVLVNPMIAAGQAHGAIAQGVGQALLEHGSMTRVPVSWSPAR